jgi:hypothetical protein
MARPAHRHIAESQPPGVDGEGLDPYPTYRDGPNLPHTTTDTKPTDVGLPASRRTSALPMLIGLIAFAIIIIGFILWTSLQTVSTSPEGLAPPESTPTSKAVSTTDEGQIRDVQPDAETGSGEVDEAPAPADVPGGEAATPVAPVQ